MVEDKFFWPEEYDKYRRRLRVIGPRQLSLDTALDHFEKQEDTLNNLVERYWENAAQREETLYRIADIYSDLIGEDRHYINHNNLSQLLKFVIQEYDQAKRDVSAPKKRVRRNSYSYRFKNFFTKTFEFLDFLPFRIQLKEKSPKKEDFVELYNSVHPLMVAYITLSLTPETKKHNEDALLVRLLHDFPEDRHKKSRKLLFNPLESYVESILNVVEDIFGENMAEGKYRKISELRESFIDVSRINGESYGHHITRLFFDKRLKIYPWIRIPKNRFGFWSERVIEKGLITEEFLNRHTAFKRLYDYINTKLSITHTLDTMLTRYSWNDEAILIPNLLAKLGDRLHNTLTMGVLRPLSRRMSTYDWEGYNYNERVPIILKNLYVIDATAEFFNYIMEENVMMPSQYKDIFRLFYLLIEATKASVKEMTLQLRKDYRDDSNMMHDFKALESALKQYKKTGNLEKRTQRKHDFNYYLENYEIEEGVVIERAPGSGPINKEIFDGTFDAIRGKVDKLFTKELYGQMAEYEDIAMLYTHLLGMKAVLENYFTGKNKSPYQFKDVKEFSDLPINKDLKPSITAKYGIPRKIKQKIRALDTLISLNQLV